MTENHHFYRFSTLSLLQARYFELMKVLPQSFFENSQFRTLLRDGLCAVVHKEIRENTFHKEGYVSVHAITLVLRGNLRVENIDKGVATLHENQMIFVPKGLYMVSDILTSDEPFVAMVFFFDEPLIESFLKSIDTSKHFARCTPGLVMPYQGKIRLFVENLLNIYDQTNPQYHRVTRAKLLEMLYLIADGTGGVDFIQALLSLKNKQKRNLKEFMSANYNKSLTVEDYAYLTGRSISTFNRDFKRQFGVAPKKWLMNMRMEMASALLSSGQQNVTDVAQEVGYENFSHFIKAFHQKYGISPKQFAIRKRNEVLV